VIIHQFTGENKTETNSNNKKGGEKDLHYP